jgi:hypothetical protein
LWKRKCPIPSGIQTPELLAIEALAVTSPSPSQETKVIADKQFLQRQYDFLRLLVRIEQPKYYEDLVRITTPHLG